MNNVLEPDLQQKVSNFGMEILGCFQPTMEDGLFLDPDHLPGTVVLIGNAGSEIWPVFTRQRPSGPDPMNRWTRGVIDPIAKAIGARALYPFDGPPYWPFQQWAKRSARAWSSPLGILMHSKHGLWHAYRAALLLPENWDGAGDGQSTGKTSPCVSCADQPCLSSCPVGAFTGEGYDVAACWSHLGSSEGGPCMSFGCLARRSCPEAQDKIYAQEHANFHMTAFLDARPEN